MPRFPKGNPALIRVILATLRDPPIVQEIDLEFFSEAVWRRTVPWLDASGLALYFLHRVYELGLETSIPANVIARLDEKRRLNEHRTANMLRECRELNEAFQASRLRYANLKGFTLAPESCEAPSLRVQSDLDFLIDPQNLEEARYILRHRGYEQTGGTWRSSEFKRRGNRINSLELQYTDGSHSSVELHIAVEGAGDPGLDWRRDPRLDRLGIWQHAGCLFPALRPEDNFIYQALHLLGHLRREHTKPSWLLEFRNHATFRLNDGAFWERVRERAREHPEAQLALGLSTLLARDLFGGEFPESFAAWACDGLPSQVLLWAECYGERSVLADVPGTKLYLFLEEAISPVDAPGRRTSAARSLLPLRLPPRWRLRSLWFRLTFHWGQGAAYLLELPRWRRLLKRLSSIDRAVPGRSEARDTR